MERSFAATISALNEQLLDRNVRLKTVLDTMNTAASGEEQIRYCRDVIFAAMGQVRETIDAVETLVSRADWPYPTYYDLLFSV